MRSLGIGGYWQAGENLDTPVAKMFREFFGVDLEPNDLVHYKVSVVTTQRKKKEILKWMKETK